MNTRKLTIVLLISFLLLSACAPGQLDELDLAGQPKSQQQAEEPEVSGEIAPRLAGAAGNAVSPPAQPGGPGGAVSSPPDQGDGSGGIIGSNGQQVAGSQGLSDSPSGAEAGQSPSLSANAPSDSTGMSQPVKWLTFTDEAHRFSIQYPDSFVILPEIEPRSGNASPDLVARVRFQTRQLASADTADLELPQFTIEVFAFPGNVPLESFVQSNLALKGFTIERYTYGDLTGLRATSPLMLAPNEFYFFAGPGFVYKLTPLGEYGVEMLRSFHILQP
jgi:hypothetical protein